MNRLLGTPMNSLSAYRLPGQCFLSSVHVIETDGSNHPITTGDGRFDQVVASVFESGKAIVETEPNHLPSCCGAAVLIPIHFDGSVVSVVALTAKSVSPGDEPKNQPVGVFEIWSPIGPYDEVALDQGFFGMMERFHNVSKFVRFEKGTGLPGLAWQHRTAVIHDDLANHPGFLRAAGASAEMLNTGLALPVVSDQFQSVVTLLSSQRTPIARAFEVWQADKAGFELVGGSYRGLGESFALPPGTEWRHDAGIFRWVTQSNNAVLCDDLSVLMHARDEEQATPGPTAALAIPQFEGSVIRSVALLLF